MATTLELLLLSTSSPVALFLTVVCYDILPTLLGTVAGFAYVSLMTLLYSLTPRTKVGMFVFSSCLCSFLLLVLLFENWSCRLPKPELVVIATFWALL